MSTPAKRHCRSPTGSLDFSFQKRLKKISIEGNIAAGKSTFVRLLEKHSDEWEVIPEPIAKWCNVQTADNEYEVGVLDLGSLEGEMGHRRNCCDPPGSCAKTQLYLAWSIPEPSPLWYQLGRRSAMVKATQEGAIECSLPITPLLYKNHVEV